VLKEEREIEGDPWRRKLLSIQEQVAQCWAPPLERRDAAEHRRHILDVARRLFAERGVDDVSMHGIARAASVGQGTLYRRYAHKGALCMDLLADGVTRFQDDVRAYLSSNDARTPALDLLDAVLGRLVAFNEENGQLLGAVVDAACGDRRTSMYGSPLYRWAHATIQAMLESAVAAGECAPLDAPYTADAMLAALTIDLYTYQRHELGYSPERITQALRRLYRDGLRGAAPATARLAHDH